jgi:uncharacterized membrane protein
MGLSTRLKGSFVAGLVLLAPLVVTLFVLRVLVNWLLQFVNPVVKWAGIASYTANIELVAQVVTTLLILLAIVVVGYLAQRPIGQRTFGNIGRLVNVVPLVNVIYGSVRQVADSLVNSQSNYERVVLVEYPREGIYSVGLVTAESPHATAPVSGGEAYNVFLPNSPNPTAGRLIVAPDDQLYEIDMSVRAALRMIVTTGIGEDGDRVPILEGFDPDERAAGDGAPADDVTFDGGPTADGDADGQTGSERTDG